MFFLSSRKAWLTLGLCLLAGCSAGGDVVSTSPTSAAASASACSASAILADDRARVIAKAERYLSEVPRTVTADIAERSAGGPNDFFSQGDYWWPVEGDPDAPYEVRDGQSNPNNFVAHRHSMVRLAEIVAALTAAYSETGDERYARAATEHLQAWFVAPDTRMNPSLLYGQAVIGRSTGRGIGIIDTLHLVEVARAAKILSEADAMPDAVEAGVKDWFQSYATWMNTHPYGLKERDWHNNHAVAWGLQVASFADFTGDEALMELVRDKFKRVWVPDMMNADGGFPDELRRTKPYGYSLFVIDLLAGVAQIASTPEDDLWAFQTEDGRGLRRGMDFIAPYVADKSAWPYGEDIAYHGEWPVRHPSFIFASEAFDDCRYYALVRDLAADSDVREVTRNFPLRHPQLWLGR